MTDLPLATLLAEWLQDGTRSQVVGLVLWLAALLGILIVVLVLFFRRRGRDNQMSSGRVYSRRRADKAHPNRLLDDRYYNKRTQNKRKL